MIESLLIFSSVVEILLIFFILFLFFRIKKSESLLSLLQKRQKSILDRLQFNEELEKKLVETFEVRQKELIFLDKKLKEKIEEIKGLLKYAEDLTASPQFLREVVLRGYRKGISIEELCKRTGLSKEEIELIIEQYT